MAPEPVPLCLDAQPSEDLAILIVRTSSNGEKQAAPQWLHRALCSSEFVCMSRTKDRVLSVVVGESLLEQVDLPKDVEVEREWVALRLDKSALDPKVALGSLASLRGTLNQCGLAPFSMSTPDSETLLFKKSNLGSASKALLEVGHAIYPAKRLCASPPDGVVCKNKDSKEYAGAWGLKKVELHGSVLETYSSSDEGRPIRLQASCGLFVDIHAKDPASPASCAGCLVHEEPMRHRLVDFQPPSGKELPELDLSLSDDEDELREESSGSSRRRETWVRLDDAREAVALELISESPDRGGRQGYWIFCGGRFARVIGLPRGQGVVAGTCCTSLAQLQRLKGEDAVRAELAAHYEAVSGTLEEPGVLNFSGEAGGPAGSAFFNAKSGDGGSIAVPGSKCGDVVHKLANGVKQRWRVIEWGFDPFTPEGEQARSASPAASDEASEGAKAGEAASSGGAKKKKKAGSDDDSDGERKKKKKDKKNKEKEKEKQKEKEKEKHKDKDKKKKRKVSSSEAEEEREEKRGRARSSSSEEADRRRKEKKEKERAKEREREKERDRDRDRDRSRGRDKDKNRDKDKKDRREKDRRRSSSRSDDRRRKDTVTPQAVPPPPSLSDPLPPAAAAAAAMPPPAAMQSVQDFVHAPPPGVGGDGDGPASVDYRTGKITINFRASTPGTRWAPPAESIATTQMVKESEAFANKMAEVNALMRKVSDIRPRKDDPAPAPPPELLRAPPSNTLVSGQFPPGPPTGAPPPSVPPPAGNDTGASTMPPGPPTTPAPASASASPAAPPSAPTPPPVAPPVPPPQAPVAPPVMPPSAPPAPPPMPPPESAKAGSPAPPPEPPKEDPEESEAAKKKAKEEEELAEAAIAAARAAALATCGKTAEPKPPVMMVPPPPSDPNSPPIMLPPLPGIPPGMPPPGLPPHMMLAVPPPPSDPHAPPVMLPPAHMMLAVPPPPPTDPNAPPPMMMQPGLPQNLMALPPPPATPSAAGAPAAPALEDSKPADAAAALRALPPKRPPPTKG